MFPVLKAMFEKISGKSPYQSPTDMGVNMAGYCIIDDRITRDASNQEIIRRYYQALCDKRKGQGSANTINKIQLLMEKSSISIADRNVVKAANNKALETDAPAAAMELDDGVIVTGKTSSLLGASSALILNVLKYLAGIADDVKLISPRVIEPIMELKVNYLGNHNPLLHLDEILIALSIAALDNSAARQAYAMLPRLKGLEAHSSVILSQIDVKVFKKLGVNLTCEPKYQENKLFHK